MHHWKIDLTAMLMSKFAMRAEKLIIFTKNAMSVALNLQIHLSQSHIYLVNAKVLSLLQTKLVLKLRKSFDIFSHAVINTFFYCG